MQPALLSEPLRKAGAPLLRLQSDQRLVRLVRAGSHPAFAEIVTRYRPALVRYTGAIVGAQRAEDVVQQGLVNAHTALMADDRTIELKPWLYRIVHNAALNLLRGERDVVALEDHEHELVVDGAEDQAASRERFRETLQAVQALPPAQRNALLLRELEGRSHEEIAAALGVTPGAARQHLMRARATMRAAVTAVTPYPALLKLFAMSADGPGALTAGAAAGGAGVSLAKIGAGLLAAGAVAGGAGVVVPAVADRHHAPQAARDAATGSSRRSGGTSIAARAAAAAPRAHTTTAALAAGGTGAAHPAAALAAGGHHRPAGSSHPAGANSSTGKDGARQGPDGGGEEHDLSTVGEDSPETSGSGKASSGGSGRGVDADR